MRKKSKQILLSLVLCLSLLVSMGTGIGPASDTGETQAAESSGFTDLDQDAIVAAMGAGWNYGNQMEATTNGIPVEDSWMHVMIKEDMFRTIARAGFKSVRLPVSWLKLIGDAPDYTLDEVRLARVKQIIDWAIKYKLYVIMNIHGDGYSTVSGGWLLPGKDDDAQVEIKAKYKAVWEQLATYFKDYDQHLIFESMNEVGADIALKSDATLKQIQGVYKNINDYNQIFLDTIRQTGGNNDKRWVLIPGMNTNIEFTADYDSEEHKYCEESYGFKIPEDTYLSKDIPEGQKRIMISVHYYSPYAFCGQEDYATTQWGDEADSTKAVGYQAEDYMVEVFGVMRDQFVSKGYPVVIGEYGAIDKTRVKAGASGKPDPENGEFRKYYAYTLCANAKANGIVPVWWDNGDTNALGYALFDRETLGVTQQDIIDGIMNVYGTNAKGTATKIELDQHYMELETNDSDGVKLAATVTPDTSTDTISWTTSDTSVATVTYKGTVRPRGVGTCIITATTASGVSDYCIVDVTVPKNLKLALYAQNSYTWTVVKGDQYCEVENGGTGGTYTISMTYDKEIMSKLTTLFLKDVSVENGSADESILQSMKYRVDEVTLNGKKIQLLADKREATWEKDMTLVEKDPTKQPGVLTPNVPAVDLCWLNVWASHVEIFDRSVSDADVYIVNEQDKASGGNGGQYYSFYLSDGSSALVAGKNTLSVTVTISDPVFDAAITPPEKTKVTSLKLSNDELTLGTGWKYNLLAIKEPADAEEQVVWFSESPKVATVDKDGKITAVAKGSTVIHALTASGVDVTCPVTVKKDDGSLQTPVPNQTPAPANTPAPDDSTPAPGGDATPAPGGNTPAPGGNTPAPGTNATPAPGANATPAPGTNVTPGTNNQPNTIQNTVTAPKKVTLKKVKSSKKKTLLVQWKKVSGATGYKVQIAKDKKFKKGKKTYTVKSAKTTKKTIKKLKSKKKYFARVCAYKKASGKTVTGKWSKAKSAKVK